MLVIDHYEANIPDFVRHTFHNDHYEFLSEKGGKVSTLCYEYNYNYDNNIKDDLFRYLSCRSTERYSPKAL